MATTIIAEQDLSRDLYEANSGYRQYYGSMNFVKQANEQASAASYNSAISNAYKTAQSQKNELNKVGFDANTNQNLTQGLHKALFSAYDTYRSKHAQTVSEANNEINSEVSQVNNALRKEGQELGSKQAQYQEGAFDYLEYLNKAGFLSQGGQFNTYDEYKAWFEQNNPNGLDANGNPVEPMNEGKWRAEWAKQQVFNGVFNEDGTLNEDKLKVAIYSELDEDGNIVKDENGQPLITNDLNTKGIEMLDRLNALPSEEYQSYASWLSKNDPKLYEWAVQRSMLGYGTNAQIAMEKLGADGVYSFMERFGGLTSDQTEKLFEGFDIDMQRFHWDNIEDSEKISENNYKAFAESTKNITDLYQYLDLDNGVSYAIKGKDGKEQVVTLTEMISFEFAEATGISFEDAKKVLETGEFSTIKPDYTQMNKAQSYATTAEAIAATAAIIAFKAGMATAGTSAGFAAAGSLAGFAGSSSSVPVVGWVVAGIALLAALGCLIWGSEEERKAKVEAIGKGNKQEGEYRRKFDQLAVQSASVAYELRKQALGQK